ncbi:transmembrane protein 246 [Corythoichthys intestinalis]|uniref:transmembrane protein 246 n=1 Tax=Corythoichthys intestinalis TaxID=161448 RepID=UPI0025A68095|nr:transmembrane protein 246 [Corythoichthys intestinalis]
MMHRLSRHARWSSGATQTLVVFTLTFCVVLPLCCQRLVYSYYFLRSVYLDTVSEDALRESLRRGQEALRFWQSADPPAISPASDEPELLVTVVTSRRRDGFHYHYLLQVMYQLSLLLAGCGERPCAQVVLCDVESGPHVNEDAKLLERHFRVLRRLADRRHLAFNTFEREKQDYAFCLRRAYELVRPRNAVVLEDDALPRSDFFRVLRELLSRRFAAGALYVKLYHPERLQRYWNPEPYRLLEWLGLGLLGGTLLLGFLVTQNPCSLSVRASIGHLALLTVYVMASAELLGRHYLLEVRRLSPQLYAVSPATECCTPAVLYPGNASLRAAAYLDLAFCSKGNAKDTVLYRVARAAPGERSYSVEPNLITHIGWFSSIRPNPAQPRML